MPCRVTAVGDRDARRCAERARASRAVLQRDRERDRERPRATERETERLRERLRERPRERDLERETERELFALDRTVAGDDVAVDFFRRS